MTAHKPDSQHAYTEIHGHGLKNEGAPYLPDKTRASHIGGTGHGLCSCGTLSPALTSNYQRKNWHRQHKRQIQ